MEFMARKYTSVSLKLIGLGLMIAAGSFWAGAGVDRRPKYRDEQTLVGGAVWSQILIPIGLLISKLVGEELDVFVQGYFMITGMLLLLITGLSLVTGEAMILAKRRRINRQSSTLQNIVSSFDIDRLDCDKIYLCIGILSLLTGLINLADLIVLLV